MYLAARMVRLQLPTCFALLACIAALAPAGTQGYHNRRLQDALDVRLVPGDLQGRLEVFRNGTWGTVCEYGFDDRDANVVCLELGFAGGRAHWGAYFGEGTGPIHLRGPDCTGNETSLKECPNLQWNATGCDHSEDVSVVCYGTQSKQTIQLVGGKTALEGRLEIRGSNTTEWGTVCDRRWQPVNAKIVCRQLDNSSTWDNATAISGSMFGTGQGVILMDGLACTGLERSIAACRFDGWGVSDCDPGTQTISINCTGTPPAEVAMPPPAAPQAPLPPPRPPPPRYPNVPPPPWSPLSPPLYPSNPSPPLPPCVSPPSHPPEALPPGSDDWWNPCPPPSPAPGPPPDYSAPDEEPPLPPPSEGNPIKMSPPPLSPDPVSSLWPPPPHSPDMNWPVGMDPPPLSPNPPPAPSTPPPPPPPQPPFPPPPKDPPEPPPLPPVVPATPPHHPPSVPPRPPSPEPPGHPYPPPPRPPPSSVKPPPCKLPPPKAWSPLRSPPSPKPPSLPPPSPKPPAPRPPLPRPPPSPRPPPPSPRPPTPPPPLKPPPRPPKIVAYEPNNQTYFKAGTIGDLAKTTFQVAKERLFLRLLCPKQQYVAGFIIGSTVDVSTWKLQCKAYPPPAPPPEPRQLLYLQFKTNCETKTVPITSDGSTGSKSNGGNRRRRRRAQADFSNYGSARVFGILFGPSGYPVELRPVILGYPSSFMATGIQGAQLSQSSFSCPNSGFDAVCAQYGGQELPPTQMAFRCGNNWTSPLLGHGNYGADSEAQVLRCRNGLLAAGIVATARKFVPPMSQEQLVVEAISLYCACTYQGC
ncbi:hypothetical protein Vretimale_19214 [Volvox reticuliferus]|uniref:SRCR domain-containing protein n=1 Tax=Volvox reticuliferus TaxID=1737510 RepID=A0A8J4M032_9CHLO|nr:hypothetical protein Vretifemale_20300 [Volvox reticuliferus]GIM16577.1 hypothetical protein Vretimale_19214 [Volvox reticuliferus]